MPLFYPLVFFLEGLPGAPLLPPSPSESKNASTGIFMKRINCTALSSMLLLRLSFRTDFYCVSDQWPECGCNGAGATASIFTGGTHTI